jgi:VanZ family protein
MRRIAVPLLPAWLRWSGVVAVGGVIFYLSVLSVPSSEPVVVGPPSAAIPLDKWRHFMAYAAFGGALAYATTPWDWSTRRLATVVLGLTILYGVGIEVWQFFIPDRYFSLGDAYANALGAVLISPWFLVESRLSFLPTRQWLSELAGVVRTAS